MGGVSIVAKRLKEARRRAGISQKQLGIKAGIDEFSASPRINQYERGKHMPGLRTLTRLAAVMQVPVAYFYCDDAELADVIVKFSLLGETQRRRLLGWIDRLQRGNQASTRTGRANTRISI
ncbi:MAG: helix-turn-helix transcriptional regulator [Steroidobacteraceae bacterium]